MLHPSCLLTPEWKLEIGGKAYFYIRFTCNEITPSLGGEKIIVKYGPDELISSSTFISSATSPDLVGPFEKISISGSDPDSVPEAYVYIYYQKNDGTAIFNHYCNILPENCSITRDPTTYSYGFEYYFGIPTPQGYWSTMSISYPGAIRVLWKKNIINLYDCPLSTVTINGQSFPLYTVNFNNLYLLLKSSTNFSPLGGLPTYSSSSYYPYVTPPTSPYDWDVLWGTGPDCSEDAGGYISGDYEIISGSQPIIISSASGNNPQFPDNIAINSYARMARICYDQNWELYIHDWVSALTVSAIYTKTLCQNF